MKIIDRLSDSLVSPSRLANSVNDKKRTTVLYALVLVLITMIPFIVMSTSLLEIDYDTKVEIRNSFFKEEINFKIENGLMVKAGEEEYYSNNVFQSFLVYVSDSETVSEEVESEVVLAFLSDGAYLVSVAGDFKILSYSDYEELLNLDFGKVKTDDLSFWNSVFDVVQDVFNRFRPMYIATYIASALFQAAITLCLCSLIFTVFNRFGVSTHLRFADHWQLCLYGSTGFVLGNTLSYLFGFVLFYYIGLLFSIVICVLSSRKFIIRGGNNEL